MRQTCSTLFRLGHLDEISDLIKANPDCLNETNKQGETALILASREGRTDVVKILVSAGARLDITDVYKYTALICAVRGEHTVIVKNLLKAKAVVDYADINGDPALLWAADNERTEIVEALLAAKYDCKFPKPRST